MILTIHRMLISMKIVIISHFISSSLSIWKEKSQLHFFLFAFLWKNNCEENHTSVSMAEIERRASIFFRVFCWKTRVCFSTFWFAIKRCKFSLVYILKRRVCFWCSFGRNKIEHVLWFWFCKYKSMFSVNIGGDKGEYE